MRGKSLMSPVEAAGYAMAPTEEDMEEVQQFEQAFRNGHAAAAEKPSSTAHPLMRLDRSVVVVELGRVPFEASRSHWLRDFFGGFWAPRAHA